MLERFERLVEQAVEGSLRRVFPTTLQPVQLARAAARAMDAAQVVGLRGREVPNVYRVRVAPSDLQRFAEYSVTLSRELSAYLVEYAAERGLHPVGEPRVELVEDATTRPGTTRVEARFVDPEPSRQAALEAAVEGTRRVRVAELRAALGSAPPPPDGLALLDRLGSRFVLEPDLALVRVGRAVDNDLVISNQRVSRYHAQLMRVDASWLVYDLDSTNGTFVNGERVEPSQPRPLTPGAVLRLGDHDLLVQVEAAAGGSDADRLARAPEARTD
jgi:pSer/pThr/pTyr-binding forkhead associated (FHA) protein